MKFYVEKDSIVRKIWGKGDTILFIFAGSAAEFALNKAVDWLYFTGRLPADPIRRLFSTVTYARKIVFSEQQIAEQAIDKITAIHSGIEQARGATIPDWAYRDVLFMLIHYSIASYELLEHKLTGKQKGDVYEVFYRMGVRMGLKDLPQNYQQWLPVRDQHMEHDLEKSNFTVDLFKQYKKHLGPIRFKILKEAQVLVMPPKVKELLQFKTYSLLKPAVPLYKLSRIIKLDSLVKRVLLPNEYMEQVNDLDIVPS